jgi:nucleotide-binding universal stress UspA family protein
MNIHETLDFHNLYSMGVFYLIKHLPLANYLQARALVEIKRKVISMFNPILVPLDGSSLAETILPHVSIVSQVDSSEVILLRVLDKLSQIYSKETVDPLDWQIRKAEASAYLDGLAAQMIDSGMKVRTVILEGKAAESIVEYAQLNNVSLIMLSSHGQSGITGWNVSSVVQKVILRARTSIMIVRAYKPGVSENEELNYRRILVPLDGSQRAESVLSRATTVARDQNAQLIIVHVIRQPEMPRRTPLTQEDQELVERVTNRNRAEAEKYLADLKSRLDVNNDTRILVSQSVVSTLHEFIEREQIDLVFLSAHGYTGETRWPYGSTVVSFIAYGTTPLLIYQDLHKDKILPSQAEVVAKEYGGR